MRLSACCLLFSLLLLTVSAEQCGRQAGVAHCAAGLCCSKFGWCGYTDAHCASGNCQSQCRDSPEPSGDLSGVISNSMFDQMLNHRNDNTCQGKNNFYSYNAFISAAKSFPGFGTSGDTTARKREIAAFFAQTSHETTGIYINLNLMNSIIRSDNYDFIVNLEIGKIRRIMPC